MVNSHFPPESMGGAEVHKHALAREWVTLGNEVHVLTRTFREAAWGSLPVKSRDGNGLYVDRLWLGETSRTAISRDLLCWSRRKLGEVRPDVVFVGLAFGMWSVAIAAHQLGIPVVYMPSGGEAICYRISFIRQDGTYCGGQAHMLKCISCSVEGWSWRHKLSAPVALGVQLFSQKRLCRFLPIGSALKAAIDNLRNGRRFLNSCSLFVAQSNFAKLFLERNGIDPSLIRVCRNGTDFERRRLRSSKYREMVTFGYMGRISKPKGVGLLVEAFKMLPPDAKAQLRIVGDLKDKNYRSFVEDLLTKCSSDGRISFEGKKDRGQVAQFLDEIDVLICPTIVPETFGNAVQEALARGTPVICSNQGAAVEMVTDGVNGLSFASGNKNDLTQCMLALIRNPELLVHVTEGAFRTRVKTIKENALEVLDVLREAAVLRRGLFMT